MRIDLCLYSYGFRVPLTNNIVFWPVFIYSQICYIVYIIIEISLLYDFLSYIVIIRLNFNGSKEIKNC